MDRSEALIRAFAVPAVVDAGREMRLPEDGWLPFPGSHARVRAVGLTCKMAQLRRLFSVSSAVAENHRLNDAGRRSETTPSLIHEVRRVSGLTYDDLAAIIGVTRRAVHHWAEGKAITPVNRTKLAKLAETLRAVDRGTQSENAEWINFPVVEGKTGRELLFAGRFDLLREALRKGRPAPRRLRIASVSRGHTHAQGLPPDGWLTSLLEAGDAKASDIADTPTQPNITRRRALPAR